MERVDLPSVATFLSRGPLAAGARVTLGEDVAHHMRVRRLAAGEPVVLLDGAGAVARGTLRQLTKSGAAVDVHGVEYRQRSHLVHMLVPVADRDRTLWLAEKCAELGAASWRPVAWRRSRGVASRGEGSAFEAKVRARMGAALAQSEGAWLPEVHAVVEPEDAIAACGAAERVVLDPDGGNFRTLVASGPVVIALGPEGGFERPERDRLVAAAFRPARLPGHILRFETAGVVALALALDALANPRGPSHG